MASTWHIPRPGPPPCLSGTPPACAAARTPGWCRQSRRHAPGTRPRRPAGAPPGQGRGHRLLLRGLGMAGHVLQVHERGRPRSPSPASKARKIARLQGLGPSRRAGVVGVKCTARSTARSPRARRSTGSFFIKTLLPAPGAAPGRRRRPPLPPSRRAPRRIRPSGRRGPRRCRSHTARTPRPPDPGRWAAPWARPGRQNQWPLPRPLSWPSGPAGRWAFKNTFSAYWPILAPPPRPCLAAEQPVYNVAQQHLKGRGRRKPAALQHILKP